MVDELERGTATIRWIDGGGPGKAIVFTHGAGMDRSTFAAQAQVVQDAGYRSIVWDLRGHGASPLAPAARFSAEDALADLDALIAALRLERPVLVGNSLGGNLAQAYARDHEVGGIIIIGATWNTGPLTSWERLQLRIAAPALALIPASRLPDMVARVSAHTPAGIAEVRRIFERMPNALFRDVMKETATFVEPDPAYRTAVPLGLIVGEHDRTGNIRVAMRAWAEADGVALHEIPGAGHVAMVDAPALASAAVLEILHSWEGAAAD